MSASPTPPSAFSIVEVVVALAVLTTLLAASLNTVGMSAAMQRHAADRAKARVLAIDLLDEIRRHPYADPTTGGGLGPEDGEATGDRSLFNDTDDYHGWTASPPQRTDGSAIPGFDGWSRSVTVEFVTLANPTVPTLTDTGLKRITVTVRRGDRVMAQAVALRTRGFDRLID